jgi:hypothetical protein
MRASAGQYAAAIPLLVASRKPAAEDLAGWNAYVDATIAFLQGNNAALLDARTRLAAVPYPAGAGMPPLRGGQIEFPSPPGQPPIRMRWPPNLEAVDGLVACFGKPYDVAYGSACRAAKPEPPGSPH